VDDATARALNRINRRFYAEQADAFSATREAPWPGWLRLAERIDAEDFPATPAVLDVGCGNGRFGRFLAGRAPALRYTGVDSSDALLRMAEQTGGLGPKPELHRLDLVEEDLTAWLGERRFDLIVLFGVLHHVPGRERRAALLRGLLRRLSAEGILALTSWRLAQFERFRERILSWRESPVALDEAQLETGDRLLPWGHGEGLRYVHFADEDETDELVASLGATVVERYEADGREDALNHYFLLRAPA
jgi:SAM-dependent methyltransferase